MLGGVEASPRARSSRSLGDTRRGARGILLWASLVAGLGLVICLVTSLATSAIAADRIRIAAQKTGTLAWELDIMRTRGLDKQADLDIQVASYGLLGMLNWLYKWYDPKGRLGVHEVAEQFTSLALAGLAAAPAVTKTGLPKAVR